MRHIISMFAFFVFTASSEAAEVDVSGSWSVVIQVQSRPRQTTMNLKQEDGRLTGTLIDARGQEIPITGSVAGDKITFSYPVTGLQIRGVESQTVPNLTVTYSGSVSPDRISAASNNQLAGEILFTATRTR